MKRRILRDAAVLILIFLGISWWQTRDLVASGEQAPALAGPTLDGRAFALSEQKGKPVLLYFFAPWCSVCKLSARNAHWIRSMLPEGTVGIAAVALDYETPESIDEFVKEAGIDGLPVVKGSDEIRDQYKISAYPTYYVVDREGRVRSKSVGYSTFLGMLFRALLG